MKTRRLIWITALALVMACVPTVTTNQSAPTIDPNVIGTYIAQTIAAAATRTSASIPTLTPSATFTPTPRFTDTPEPTATATVILIFHTSTPIVLPTLTVVSSDRPYACQILGVRPANGAAMNSRDDFDARWQVKNIGRKEWDRNSVDYIYLGGDKFHKVEGYDLGKSVKAGETSEIIVDMIAPKNSGSYSTNWTLRVGSERFCTLSLTIVVR